MTGHPLLDFIMFDQLFNGDKDSGGGSDNGNDVSHGDRFLLGNPHARNNMVV